MKYLFFTLISLASLGCGAAPTCPVATPPPPLASNRIATRSCDVLYDPGLEADGRRIADVVDASTASLMRDFGAAAETAFARTKCRVHVFGFRSNLASESDSDVSIMRQPPKGEHVADLFYFAPSLFEPNHPSSAGQPKDADWWSLRVTAGLMHVIIHDVTENKPKGWRYGDAPRWFQDGLTEYVGCTDSTAKGRAIVLPTYVSRVKADATRVKIDPNIEVRKPWDDGAVLFAFLHDTLGKDHVRAILTSPAPTFDAAFDEAIGPDRAALAAKFSAWLQKQP